MTGTRSLATLLTRLDLSRYEICYKLPEASKIIQVRYMPFGNSWKWRFGAIYGVQCSTRQDLVNKYERLVHAYFFMVTAVKDGHRKDSEVLREVGVRCENVRNHLERHKFEHG